MLLIRNTTIGESDHSVLYFCAMQTNKHVGFSVHKHLELSRDDKILWLEDSRLRPLWILPDVCWLASLVCLYPSATESYTAFISTLQHFVDECVPQCAINERWRVRTGGKHNSCSYRQCIQKSVNYGANLTRTRITHSCEQNTVSVVPIGVASFVILK